MARGAFIGVDGTARKLKQLYLGVDGVARKVKNGYVGVDGMSRLYFKGIHYKFITSHTATYPSSGDTWSITCTAPGTVVITHRVATTVDQTASRTYTELQLTGLKTGDTVSASYSFTQDFYGYTNARIIHVGGGEYILQVSDATSGSFNRTAVTDGDSFRFHVSHGRSSYNRQTLTLTNFKVNGELVTF